GQLAAMLQFLAPPFDMALVGKFAKHALENNAIRILQPEGAGDFTRADLGGLIADECKEFFLGGLSGMVFGAFHKNDSSKSHPRACRRRRSQAPWWECGQDL